MRHAFHSTRLTCFQQVCAAHDIRHYLLRPYKPQSNGKVERLFRTVNDECLHVRPLFTFAARSRAVDEYLWYYNHQRPSESRRHDPCRSPTVVFPSGRVRLMSWDHTATSYQINRIPTLEAGRKLEAGSWELEAGSWKLEAGSSKLLSSRRALQL
jgi:hypothetical protein